MTDEPTFCPCCGDELEDGCCEGCDDIYAANDNYEEAISA